MKINKKLFVSLALGLSVASLVVFFSSSDALQRLKLVGLDTLFRCRRPVVTKTPIVIVEINDYNISKVGRWPWERSWHAAMVKILKDLGAKYIYFDIIFSETANTQDDEAFGQGIAYAGNVFLPYAFSDRNFDITSALLPLEKFRKHITGSGFINIYPDMDGCLRRVPLFFYHNNKPYYHLAVELARGYLKTAKIFHTEKQLTLSGPEGTINIPLVPGNNMLVNWTSRWEKAFKHYSFLDVINGYQGATKVDLSSIKGSVCIVAVTALGLYDIKPIPLQSEYPAVGVLATTLDNIVNGKFVDNAPQWLIYVLIFLLALLPPLCISESPFKQAIPFVAVPVVFLAAVVVFGFNVWIDYTMPMTALVVSYIVVNAYNMAVTLWEKRRLFRLAVTDELTNLYNIRYFRTRLGELCASGGQGPAGIFCVVMADIDHFKKFNDSYGHQTGDLVLKEVAAALKGCLRPDDIIARYGGEEIIVYLQGANLKNGTMVSERMRKQVESKVITNEKGQYKVTVSMGVACFRRGDTETSIIARADEGLYKAKETGRNRVETAESM